MSCLFMTNVTFEISNKHSGNWTYFIINVFCFKKEFYIFNVGVFLAFLPKYILFQALQQSNLFLDHNHLELRLEFPVRIPFFKEFYINYDYFQTLCPVVISQI